jgi:hypothetical protein
LVLKGAESSPPSAASTVATASVSAADPGAKLIADLLRVGEPDI